MAQGEGIRDLLGSFNHSAAPDVLAQRYATDPMQQIWSPEGSIFIERNLQVAVMQAQANMGVDIPQEHIEDYRRVMGDIDLDEIREIEKRTKHDVNARITSYNRAAGHQHVGEAMTSRDHTEPSEQLQARLSMQLIQFKTAAMIGSVAHAAAAEEMVALTGRTHNVPAEMTTLGKRFSMSGEELIDAYNSLTHRIDTLKFRGIKGAVGTQQAMLDLFEGDEEKVDRLDEEIAALFGFSHIYNSVGQITPRSQDLSIIQALSHVIGPVSNFATNIRKMAGYGLLVEDKTKRTGSNAMPHKNNPRTAERIVGFYNILGGFEAMLRPVAGQQWFEGDVSCSVVRRVAMPGSFHAADGALEAGLNIVNGYGLFPEIIHEEVDGNLPFLASSKILTLCILRGMGREDAHTAIKDHAFKVVENMQKGQLKNDLLERLGADEAIPVTHTEIMAAVERPLELAGRASTQVKRFVAQAQEVLAKHPGAIDYKGSPIL
jgi:adenylosuccinate lyase